MEPEDQTREEEDTDTAMADTKEIAEAIEPNSPDSRESSDSDSEDEAQQKFELQNILSYLTNEPSNYEVLLKYLFISI